MTATQSLYVKTLGESVTNPINNITLAVITVWSTGGFYIHKNERPNSNHGISSEGF
jgi:hypothetical protein